MGDVFSVPSSRMNVDADELVPLQLTIEVAVIRNSCQERQGSIAVVKERDMLNADHDDDMVVKARRVGNLEPAAIDQQIRQAIHLCWLGLPQDHQTMDEVETRIRRLVDRALHEFRYERQRSDNPFSIRTATSAAYYFDLGESHCARGELEEAIAAFTESLRLDPLGQDALIKRCWAYLHKGDYSHAIADATEALKVSPDNSYLLNYRGIAHFKTKEHERALEDYSAALRSDPEFAVAYYNRGNVHLHRKNWPQAIEDYRSCLRVTPGFLPAIENLAKCHVATRQYQLAVETCEAILDEDEAHLKVHNSIAWLLATCPDKEARNGQRAVEHAMRACELCKWQKAYVLDTLAAAFAEMGQFEEAVKWQHKAIELKGDDQEYIDRLTLYEGRQPFRG